ncbi:hypothetical protein MJG53_007759 [Ovis ammon polii x Ovis aries]|uniref:Uncharacterized protein n=1 Tax=Ovis ammon polii x Ovis aries TaxID=2918886 RepID=A0ACB9V3K4_9CETA|nr:hypothetical protein MJG53_007759 [Ovis ammon polii x Ovis aries]
MYHYYYSNNSIYHEDLNSSDPYYSSNHVYSNNDQQYSNHNVHLYSKKNHHCFKNDDHHYSSNNHNHSNNDHHYYSNCNLEYFDNYHNYSKTDNHHNSNRNTATVTTTTVTTAPEKMRPSTSAFLMPSPTKDFQPDLSWIKKILNDEIVLKLSYLQDRLWRMQMYTLNVEQNRPSHADAIGYPVVVNGMKAVPVTFSFFPLVYIFSGSDCSGLSMIRAKCALKSCKIKPFTRPKSVVVLVVGWEGTDYSTDDWMCKDREPGEQWQSTCFHRKDDSVMHPWVAILGFLLLLPDGVTSYRQVIGVEGQSVTLPCFYEGKVTSICWGRGRCSWIDCRNTVISTDGYKVTEQKNERYKLKGDIAPPTTTVSPTTTSESTSESTSTTNIPRTTYTTAPRRKTTIPERNSTTTVVTDTRTTTGASTSALPMPTPTEDHKPGLYSLDVRFVCLFCDGERKVSRRLKIEGETLNRVSPNQMARDDCWVLCGEAHLGHTGVKTVFVAYSSYGFYRCLISVPIFLILSLEYLCLGNKVEPLCVIPLKESHIGALKQAALKPIQAEDNAYIVDDSH